MKFKAALKYQLSDMKRPLIIFYIVIYCIISLMLVQQASMKNIGEFSSSGIEMASVIFLFVAGLNSFKVTFHLFLANGISRKTMFKSYITSLLPIVAGMAIIDTLNGLLLSSPGHYRPMFYAMYQPHYGAVRSMTAGMYLDGFIWMFFLYAFATMAGFFLTTLFYRMNKALKLLVSIGVPVFFFIVLPYIDTTLFMGKIYNAIWYIFRLAGGFLNGHNPYIAVLSCAISFALFGGLSFLAMRKATVK